MTAPRDPWFFQRWAWDVTVGSVAGKACLAFLAKCADSQTGRCEAKQATIAHGIEAAERTVREHLATLEARGLIARRPQFRIDRGRRNDEFLLLAPGITAWPDGQPVDVQPAAPAGSSVDVQPAASAGGLGDVQPAHSAGGPVDDRPAESAGGPGAADREEPAATSGTPRGVSRPPRKNGHRGTTTHNDAAGSARADADGLRAALERLEPFVVAGRLHPPRADGGDAVLADALREHGSALVAAALDHVVAWAGSPEPLRSPHLSRLLPTALGKARRASRSDRADGAASTRRPWETARTALREAVATHRNQLDTLVALSGDVALASVVVAAGWGDVVTVARGADTYETRQATSRLRQAWVACEPDAAAVERHVAALDAQITAHCTRAGIDRVDLGVRTPPGHDGDRR